MLEPLRRAAVRTVKPHVSDQAWDRLRGLAPRTEEEKKQARRQPGAETDAPLGQPGLTTPPRLPPGIRYSLESLATFFGTDKWGVHRYASLYARHLSPLRKDRFTLLEIGIGGYRRERTGGASLRMWKHYFPKAQIIGLDIYDKSFVNQDRILAYQGSQTDELLLRKIARQHGPLGVVVDDGSHRPEHIRATFDVLFPLLADGGFYVIEDTQTSYWPRWGGSLDLDDKTTTMGLVKDLVDGLNYEEFGDTSPRNYADAHVVAVHCYHNLVVLEKGTNREGGRRPRNWNQVG